MRPWAVRRICPACGADMELRAVSQADDPAHRVEHWECPPCGRRADSSPGSRLALELIVEEVSGGPRLGAPPPVPRPTKPADAIS